MNRREAVTALGSVVIASGALAQSKDKAAPAPAAKPVSLAATARACADAGDECQDHCINMLSSGDKSMADCFAAVRQMLPVCNTLEQLARLNSPHLKAYAAVCATYCRDCEKACKPHAAQMAVCKTCMEACAACAAACEKA
jgi:Cys-rich four helix bundle protein (predicted Tat secretion target)